MKSTVKNISVMIVMMAAANAEPTGEEILNRLIEVMNPGSARAIIEQTIQTTSGDLRTFKYESFMSSGGEKNLIRYLSPSRVKGNAILMTDFADNIWMYYSRTKRVRKLASHAKKQRFEGSDFTYEDMGSGDSWKDDYEPVNMGEEEYKDVPCTTLQLNAVDPSLSYSRMVCLVRTSDYYPLKIDYYDEEGTFTKSLYLEDVRVIDGFPTAMKMTMKNHIDRTETVMKTLEISYDVEFDENFFSERTLKQ